MSDKWLIFCEESGDKEIPWKDGSSDFYVVTAVLVKECDEADLIKVIEKYKYKELRLKCPLEWKKLSTSMKKNDKKISRFLRQIEKNGPEFIISTVVCNKHETMGEGFKDKNIFMNYLYGLMFKRISSFLSKTNSSAKLTIDRNTDKFAQESLREYISAVSRYTTGSYPRHSKPRWINPEEHPILGLADFISGISLRALKNYLETVDCEECLKKLHCIYDCNESNFEYKRSYKYIVEWNEQRLSKWHWKGLLYHPFECKDNYLNIFRPK